MSCKKVFLWKKFFLLLQKNYFLVLGKLFKKISKNLTASAFLLWNGDIPQQNPQHLLTAKANFECCVCHLTGIAKFPIDIKVRFYKIINIKVLSVSTKLLLVHASHYNFSIMYTKVCWESTWTSTLTRIRLDRLKKLIFRSLISSI